MGAMVHRRAQSSPSIILLMLFLLGVGWGHSPAQVYEKVYSFLAANATLPGAGTVGNTPQGLILGRDGNFYGVTSGGGGGANNQGTVFEVTPAGVMTTLAVFNGNNGSTPIGQLVQGTDGNFYGVTSGGGANGDGTAFKVTSGGVLTKLVDFTGTGGSNRGSTPQCTLIQGTDGNFYGTTTSGGTNNVGTVFKVTGSGNLTTLVDFTTNGSTNRGSTPIGPLIQGSDGDIYGTTAGGGTNGNGTVFKMSLTGTLTTLVSFSGSSTQQNRGGYPEGGVIQGSDGDFFGTTADGGADGDGTVFKMTPDGVVSTLVDFTNNGTTNRGANPETLVEGNDSNFYGTTETGGANDDGTVFQMTPEGTLTTLVDFDFYDGTTISAGLVQGNDGNFYGTAGYGGSNLCGTVFQVTSSGALTTLVNFISLPPMGYGAHPNGVIQGSDGNLYGTAEGGGLTSEFFAGDGSIFQLTPAGALTTLNEFSGSFFDGCVPFAGLIEGNDGNFYGTTSQDGANGFGTIFQVTPSGSLSILASLPGNGQSRSGGPYASQLIQGSNGTFYGTTSICGTNNLGTIFSITAAGSFSTLVNFTGSTTTTDPDRGANPAAGLVVGRNGNFYGTTSAGGVNGAGTVFEMTPTGVLTTLVDFTGSTSLTDPNRGAGPAANLFLGSDGNFYGTTSAGGADGDGTAFKMTPAGAMTTLVDFTGNGQSNIGSSPNGLIQASDGNYYGTTESGGATGSGTIFQMSPSGNLTTIYDLANDPADGVPNSALIQGTDGNLYGTTLGGDGTVFRLVFPGTPMVYLNPPSVQGTASASFTLSANARGANTSVILEYGTDPTLASGTSVPLVLTLKGYATTPLGTTLNNLIPGTTYYFQIVATNNYGRTTTAVASFTTLEAPAAAATNATGVSQTSETLSGTVDAYNSNTTVLFQYSADGGQTFPYSAAATTPVGGTVTGSGMTTVSVTIDGTSASTPLASGTTYYYRISATNAGGTTVSGVQSFKTLSAPMVMVTGASLVGTSSAQLNATVDAMGAATTVEFVYGTVSNGVFTQVLNPLVAGVVSAGSTNAAVSVNTSASAPLTQGGTYAYYVIATSLGGTTTTLPTVLTTTFQVEVLSGLTQQFPYYAAPSPSTQVYAPLPAMASLSITLIPSASGNYTPGWRLVGEQLWHASGDVVSGLTMGDYEVEYRPSPGYIQPANESVSVTSGTTTVNETMLTRYYYPTPSPANLSLQIYLYPQNVGMEGGWRLYGSSTWNASGYVLQGLSPGIYLVECEPVPNQTAPQATAQITPPLSSVVVAATTTVVGGVTTVNTATVGQISYSPANATTSGVMPPQLVGSGGTAGFATITNSSTQGQTMPYAYVGQIRSDVGLSSGFAVAPYVVATAAHVVFDDGTLTANGQGTLGYVSNLQWIFEREAGTYDPVPQTPRGALVLSSYSADRVADGTPGVSSVTSQNEDVAALYFSSYAGGAGGGYSGYLASDAASNEFLTTGYEKMLVGYPVDTEPTNEQGEMFATVPVTNAFTQQSDSSGNLLQVYSTNALYSFGGNSGGPLCVQYNGTYYPAAIYLGESAQAVVRAIDSDVISLFTQAETNGENNENFTGGGTTLVSTTITAGVFGVASIQINLPGAPAGAGWSLGPIGVNEPPTLAGGFNAINQATGEYIINYATVPYYLAPANFTVTLADGGAYVYSANYEGISTPPVSVSAAQGAGAMFTVTTTGTPTAYQWQYVSGSNPPVNLTGPGATTSTYTLSNLTSANAGNYQVKVTFGSDGSVTSAPATLTVIVPQVYSFTQWTGLYPLLTNTAATATPQHDGVPNLMKYLFDIDPTRPMSASDIAALPVVGTTTISNQPYLTLTFREYKNLDSGVTITVQTTSDLSDGSWTNPAQATVVPTGGTATGDPPPGQSATTDPIMEARVPLTAPGRQFIRLEVNSP